MKKEILIRIVVGIIMLCLIIWGYWWLFWCLAIILLFYFKTYFEIIFFGILYDSLYGIALTEFGNIKYVFTIVSIILFLIALLLKKRLTIYRESI